MITTQYGFHSMSLAGTIAPLTTPTIAGGTWNLMPVRTNIRNHFPRAKETKRIKVHGWLTRLSTKTGRRVLMRRILKGRHVLSH